MKKKGVLDTYITLYGRKPVLEALMNNALQLVKLFIAQNARGESIEKIIRCAEDRAVPMERVAPEIVQRFARNGKQDQGVALDIFAPKMSSLSRFLSGSTDTTKHREKLRFILIDGVTTPANIGLIIRSAAAAGVGIIYPKKGVPRISPLIVKSSAGLIFKSQILHCETVKEALYLLKEKGFAIFGVSGEGDANLFDLAIPDWAVFVVGNESYGIGKETIALSDTLVRIPMVDTVESLNVACAATLVAYECIKA